MDDYTDKNIKEITRRDHVQAIESLQIFKADVDFLDREFFDFQIAFTGLLGISLTIIFSNIDYFSLWFLIIILAVTLLTFSSCIYNICVEAKGKFKALEVMERSALLAKIRNIAAIHKEFAQYGVEAEKIHSEDDKLFQAMKGCKKMEEILKELTIKREWKLYVFWWSALILSVPILFIFQLIYPKV